MTRDELVAVLTARMKHCVRRHERLTEKSKTVGMGTNERLMMANYGALASAYSAVVQDAERLRIRDYIP